MTVKTRARAVSIGGPAASLVAAAAAAATGLSTAAGTGTIAGGAAGTARGLLPKVKVIRTCKTLFS